MPDHYVYLRNLERRMRMQSNDPEERTIPLSMRSPDHCERMPFPIDGLASGFDGYLQEWVDLGELDQEDARMIEQSVRADITQQAFDDLAQREELKPQLERMRDVVRRVGY
jgi:hypothetical protein